MRTLRGLTIIIAAEDPARFDAALTLAAANAALGASTRIYCHGTAVRLLADGPILATAVDLGVTIIACQTALADHDMRLPDYAEGGGMIGLLTELGDDRLLAF